MPKTVAVSVTEGSEWTSFAEWQRNRRLADNRVHAVMFENGMVWDAVNGWREKARYINVTGASIAAYGSQAIIETLGAAVQELIDRGHKSVTVDRLPPTGDGHRYLLRGES